MSDLRLMAFVTEPGKIEVRLVPIPELGDYDVHIKVKVATICGSDLHIFRGAHPSVTLPIPVGHEISGEVVQVGSMVEKVKPGDRVTVEPVITCDSCMFCERGDYHLCVNISFQYRVGQGGITTDFVALERWVHQIPDGISYLAGALVEPLSVGLHAVRRAGIKVGDDVAIFGAGPIGLMILQSARAMGAGKIIITDVRSSRLETAARMGANVIINSSVVDAVSRIRTETSGFGVAIGFEAVGLEITLLQMLESLRKGGGGVLVGLFEEPKVQIPGNLLVQKEIGLLGSQGYHWDFQRSLELIVNSGLDIEPMITHQFSLEETQHAFDFLEDPGENAVKAAIVF